jgi:hypothetical protein
MDTSEETVFLHVQSHGGSGPLGNIYVSDGSGRYYSMSIADVYRGTDLVDFEKINSLEGVFISNRYEARAGITKANANASKKGPS